MRSDIFIKWLHYVDNWFYTADRKILLIIDNAGSHFNPKILEDIDNGESDLNKNDSEENVAESSTFA